MPEAVLDDVEVTVRRSDLAILKKMRERQRAYMRAPQSMKLLHECAVLETMADDLLARYAGEPSPAAVYDHEFFRAMLDRWCAEGGE